MSKTAEKLAAEAQAAINVALNMSNLISMIPKFSGSNKAGGSSVKRFIAAINEFEIDSGLTGAKICKVIRSKFVEDANVWLNDSYEVINCTEKVEFFELLRGRFGQVIPIEIHIDQFQTATQRKEESAVNFAARLRGYLERIMRKQGNYKFKLGSKADIREKMAMQGHFSDLQECVNWVTRQELVMNSIAKTATSNLANLEVSAVQQQPKTKKTDKPAVVNEVEVRTKQLADLKGQLEKMQAVGVNSGTDQFALSDRRRQNDRYCFKCGLLGHMAMDCRTQTRNYLCHRCDGRGHIEKYCNVAVQWNEDKRAWFQRQNGQNGGQNNSGGQNNGSSNSSGYSNGQGNNYNNGNNFNRGGYNNNRGGFNHNRGNNPGFRGNGYNNNMGRGNYNPGNGRNRQSNNPNAGFQNVQVARYVPPSKNGGQTDSATASVPLN
uniref:CCHC-type domain-containing protein n=1 Tax=Strigamia maritima TaxID=126957 RepID=T1JDH8_STRMM